MRLQILSRPCARVRYAIRSLHTALALTIGLLSAPASEARPVHASIVVDADSGAVLHEVNADRRTQPASLTKMMTLYMVFEALDQGRLRLTQRLRVSRLAARMPPSKLGLRAGHTIPVLEAILALVTKSANDVAVVVAEALAGSEWRFARQMTQKAQRLGLLDTYFRNASGLPNDAQYTTARDMTRLALILLKHFPRYYRWFSVTAFRYNGRTYRTHNHLLEHYYGSDGLKTGYVRASGFNLVTSVVRGRRRLVATILGGRTAQLRDIHMTALLDTAFTKVWSPRYRVASYDRIDPPAARVAHTIRRTPARNIISKGAIYRAQPARRGPPAYASRYQPRYKVEARIAPRRQ